MLKIYQKNGFVEYTTKKDVWVVSNQSIWSECYCFCALLPFKTIKVHCYSVTYSA